MYWLLDDYYSLTPATMEFESYTTCFIAIYGLKIQDNSLNEYHKTDVPF